MGNRNKVIDDSGVDWTIVLVKFHVFKQKHVGNLMSFESSTDNLVVTFTVYQSNFYLTD